MRSTPLDHRVLEVLRTVRVGAVVTYAALARRIGRPDALDAVADACANIPLAFTISCDRVVRRRPVVSSAVTSVTFDAAQRCYRLE
jgi:O-6-methylguanine DNA methyltransferase